MTTSENPVSNFVNIKTLDQLREHLVSDLRISKQLSEKLLIHLVYAGLGFRAIRDILPKSDMKLKTYLSKNDWRDDFEQDLPHLDGYLAIGDAFQYDPSYLNILSRAKCLTLIPSDQKRCELSVQEQLTAWRHKGVKINSVRDLFTAAKNGLLRDYLPNSEPDDSQQESRQDADPVISKEFIPHTQEEAKEANSQDRDAQPVRQENTEPSERNSGFDFKGFNATAQAPTSIAAAPPPERSPERFNETVTVKERIFHARLRELQDMCKTFSRFRALFDTQTQFKPLSEWGDAVAVLKDSLLPCEDIIRQLSEV